MKEAVLIFKFPSSTVLSSLFKTALRLKHANLIIVFIIVGIIYGHK